MVLTQPNTKERNNKMNKGYIVTEVTHNADSSPARVIAVELGYEEADKARIAAMREARARYSDESVFDYNEDTGILALYDETDIVWSVAEIDIKSPLTPLQTTFLNELAAKISQMPHIYADYEDLGEEEREYLVGTLQKTYGVDIAAQCEYAKNDRYSYVCVKETPDDRKQIVCVMATAQEAKEWVQTQKAKDSVDGPTYRETSTADEYSIWDENEPNGWYAYRVKNGAEWKEDAGKTK